MFSLLKSFGYHKPNMLPIKFIRNVDEGGYKIYNNVTFNHSAGTAITTKGPFKIPNCIQDVVSAMYYARNIDFSKYKPAFFSEALF